MNPAATTRGLAFKPPYRRKTVFATLLVCGCVIALLSACQATTQFRLTPEELMAEINTGRPPLIVDARSKAEYERGHVPGAKHVSFLAARSGLKELTEDETTRVIVYCAHGPRAGIARVSGRLAGYTQLGTLTGHMSAWTKRGLPVESGRVESDD